MDTTSVEIVSKSFDKFVEKFGEQAIDKPSIWDTLTPLLIGAGLTIVTQLLIEFWKSNKETNQKKQELISRGRAKTYLIAQILKDLAMYKVHKQYYIRAYKLSTDTVDKEDSFKKHYEKGQEQRHTEAKLDECIAEYFQLVTEYIILVGKKDHFKEHFQQIFQYTHPKSSKFENCFTDQELIAGLEEEEKRLNEQYVTLRNIFESIQTAML